MAFSMLTLLLLASLANVVEPSRVCGDVDASGWRDELACFLTSGFLH